MWLWSVTVRLLLVLAFGLLVLSSNASCQSAPRHLTPAAIRESPSAQPRGNALLTRWQLASDLANEFLESSFNRSLPAGSRVALESHGMRFEAPERTVPVTIVLVDEHPTSACVCANVNTHENLLFAFRPWGEDSDESILTCNTFFDSSVGALSLPEADLAQRLLRLVTILYYERASHISVWEWFKCQWLEWLIGSGHHRISMQRPTAVSHEFFHFWHGIDPPTPTILSLLKREPGLAEQLEARKRESGAWQTRFSEMLEDPDTGAHHGPYQD